LKQKQHTCADADAAAVASNMELANDSKGFLVSDSSTKLKKKKKKKKKNETKKELLPIARLELCNKNNTLVLLLLLLLLLQATWNWQVIQKLGMQHQILQPNSDGKIKAEEEEEDGCTDLCILLYLCVYWDLGRSLEGRECG
jgi:hypothetical protein